MDFWQRIFPKKIYRSFSGKDRLEILDYGSELSFEYNGIVYSKIKKNSIYTGQYWDYFLPSIYVFEKPNILIIGMGAGTVPFQIQKLKESAKVTVVELNEKMKEIAEVFLPERLKASIIIGDGLEYIKQVKQESYDIIMLDAYVNTSIPSEFLTQEFVEYAYRVLKHEGLLLVNFGLAFMSLFAYASYTRILGTRFRVYSIKTAVTESNIILLCSKSLSKEEIIRRIKESMPASKETLPLIKNYEEMKEELH